MIEADDLALLAKSFEATMLKGDDRATTEAALLDLGWAELLSADPNRGAAAAFTLLGWTGSSATLLDDTLLAALGVPGAVDTCVVLPGPHRAVPAGVEANGQVVVRGLVSARINDAQRIIVPVAADGTVVLVEVEAGAAKTRRGDVLEPADSFRYVDVALAGSTGSEQADWTTAVRHARLALAHQLIGASRRMLDLARVHAIDRVQFGRPVASFQAVRHKLADALVAIESAAAVADAAVEQLDDLTAAVAKSLAGRAARVTATHAQQVLAGIGFTTEHSYHLFLKRTMVLDTLFGSARTLPVEIGRTLLAQRTAPRLVEL